jgi:UDP-N-acetylmuramoyl-tripeptide--D-alanyl-D-alanine ligase
VIDWDAARLAEAAGARLLGARVQGGPRRAVIDSREVRPGDLFVGLAGEREDGGAYAEAALDAGAWGVLVTPEHAHALPRQASAAAATLAHHEPLRALQQLAATWRRELGAKVVAITGSTGKTSTKDILAAVLGGHLRTVASPQNLNTEIGLPLAVLAAPRGTEALVLELAMRGPGQIAELAAIAQPDVGVIVNVGPVHLELLGSLEAVAAAKAELIAGLRAGSTIVLPHDEPLLEPHRRADLRTLSFGEGGDVWLRERAADGEVVLAAADPAGGERRIALRPSFAQSHNLRNLLAAVAAAQALGVTPGGRLDVVFSALRGERIALADEIVLINDCYNANPMSMRAALDDLADSAPARRVAVLGDMLELGDEERRFHREIGAYARQRGVDVLVTVGRLAAEIGEGFALAGGSANVSAGVAADARAGTAPGATSAGAVRDRDPAEVHAVPDVRAAAPLLPELLRPRDTVLVKGSRGVGLELIAETLAGGAR